MVYVTQNLYGVVTIYSKKPQDIPYLEVESLPEGEGILRTDLKTVWLEPYPERIIEIPLDKKLQAQQDRMEFLEDCIAEMAQIVYN